MVQFGFNDDDVEETQAIQSDEPNDEGPGPDDTFAYRMHIPGGFDLISMDTSVPLDTREDSTVIITTGPRQVQPIEEDEDMMDLSPSNEILPESDTTVRFTSSERSTSYTSTASMISIDDANPSDGWPDELRASVNRHRLLASHRRAPKHQRTQKATPKSSYNQQELDSDLFRKSAPFFRSADTRLNDVDHDPKKLRRPGFLFNWAGRGAFLRIAANSDTALSIHRLAKSQNADCERCLATQLAYTNIEVVDGLPCATPDSKLTAAAVFNTDMTLDMQSLWQLTSALYDPISIANPDTTEAFTTIITETKRRTRVSDWLESCVAVSSQEEQRQFKGELDVILFKLMGNQLVGACAVALSSGNYRLATLLPLAGGDEHVRNDLSRQIEYWRDHGYSGLIAETYRTILELLSGNVLQALSSTRLGISSGSESGAAAALRWKRVFGLYLWFRLPKEAPLADVMEIYESEGGSQFPSLLGTSSDIQFHLLRMYTARTNGIEPVFDPSGLCSDPLNFQHNWMLYLYLCKDNKLAEELGYDSAKHQNSADKLTKCFADQLDCLGKWEWSLFVVLHLKSGLAREALAKDILARYSSKITPESSQFLKEHMKIPELWILEANALRARAEKKFEAEALLLMSAGLFMEAHRTTLAHIAPQAIISGELTQLKSILDRLSSGHALEDWESGGQIYADALTLIQLNRSQQSRYGKDSLHKVASRLAKSLPGMHQSTLDQRIANVELSTLVNRMLITFSDYASLIALGKKDSASSFAAINATSSDYFRTSFRDGKPHIKSVAAK